MTTAINSTDYSQASCVDRLNSLIHVLKAASNFNGNQFSNLFSIHFCWISIWFCHNVRSTFFHDRKNIFLAVCFNNGIWIADRAISAWFWWNRKYSESSMSCRIARLREPWVECSAVSIVIFFKSATKQWWIANVFLTNDLRMVNFSEAIHWSEGFPEQDWSLGVMG